jgi:hypothetical protein
MELKGHNIMRTVLSAVLVAFLIISCGVIIFKKNAENMNLWVMYENCCNGSECTDTYYDPEDNTCHLVLCEGLFNAKTSIYGSCVYAGANKTITVIQ